MKFYNKFIKFLFFGTIIMSVLNLIIGFIDLYNGLISNNLIIGILNVICFIIIIIFNKKLNKRKEGSK